MSAQAKHPPTHGHLQVGSSGALHAMSATAKLLGLIVFVVAVAVTPRTAVWAFAIDAVIVGVLIVIARIPLPAMIARLSVLVPFIAFAFLLPVIGRGARTSVGPVSLSTEGLWAAWAILAKAILGTAASIVFASTTSIPDVITALGRLGLPRPIVGIVAFFFRYLDLLADRFARMRQAMVARGHDPRWLWQAKPIAQSAGSMFVRTYERGERVHHAMLARGFSGTMPTLNEDPARQRDVVVALIPGLIAIVVAAAAWFNAPTGLGR